MAVAEKYCVDCKHFYMPKERSVVGVFIKKVLWIDSSMLKYGRCSRTSTESRSLVTGEVTKSYPDFCSSERSRHGSCKPEALLFESKNLVSDS